MNLSWWGWLLLVLWCFPAVSGALALLLQKPILGLDENGEPYKPVPFLRTLLGFPFALLLLLFIRPRVFWSEYRDSRS
jgi:hypothetical protein